MRTIVRITKREFYAAGSFSNSRLFRKQRGLFWGYYRILQ